jgi:hypothetical protein
MAETLNACAQRLAAEILCSDHQTALLLGLVVAMTAETAAAPSRRDQFISDVLGHTARHLPAVDAPPPPPIAPSPHSTPRGKMRAHPFFLDLPSLNARRGALMNSVRT